MQPTITSPCLDDTLLTTSSLEGVVTLSIHNLASVTLMFRRFGAEDFTSADGGTPLLVAQPSRCCYYGMHLEGGDWSLIFSGSATVCLYDHGGAAYGLRYEITYVRVFPGEEAYKRG